MDPHVARGLDYCRKITTGEIPACKYVVAACQRQLNDLERAKNDPSWRFRFDEAKAGRAARYLEQLPHVKGPKAGELFRLEDWQCFVVTTVYGWVRKDTGARRFRRVYEELPRGNGKSFKSSGIALFGLSADGEEGAEVYSAATTTSQALIVHGDAEAMLRKRPKLIEKLGLKISAHAIYQRATNSSFVALSREAKNHDGKNIHTAVVDELHAHPTRELWDVLITGAAKRPQSLIWAITTAGFDTSGICYEVRESVVKMLEGAENDALFGIIYTIDNEPRPVPCKTSEAACKELEKLCDCDARTTTASRPTRRGSVEPATTATSGRPTPSTGNGRPTTLLGGQNATPSESPPPTPAGEPSQASKSDSPSSSASTEEPTSPWPSSKDSNPSILTAATFAAERAHSLSTTATRAGASADFSAATATAPSASSETTQKLLSGHSATCRAQDCIRDLEGGGFVVTIPPDDWRTEESWIKANPNWHASIDHDAFRLDAVEALQTASKENNFKTKHLNVWCNAEVAWMQMAAWDACADSTLKEEDFAKQPVTVGLDLASKIDLAAKSKIFTREITTPNPDGTSRVDRHYYCFLDSFLPERAVEESKNSQYEGWVKDGWITTTPGDVLDFAAIRSSVISDRDRFDLREVAFDPWQAQQLANELQAESVVMVEVRPVVQNFSEAMKDWEAFVLSGRFHHDGNPLMRWMVSNVVCHRDAKDNIYPRKLRVENKIDGPVATIMGLNRARLAKPPPPDPYATGGFRQL